MKLTYHSPSDAVFLCISNKPTSITLDVEEIFFKCLWCVQGFFFGKLEDEKMCYKKIPTSVWTRPNSDL